MLNTTFSADAIRPERKNTIVARDYLLVLLLVCLSGNTSFDAIDRQQAVLIASCCLAGVLLIWYRKLRPTLTLSIVIMAFATILIIQGIIFEFFPVITITGFFTRLFIAYAVFRLVENFPRIYTKVIYHISIVSFLFYVPDSLCRAIGIDFRSLFEPLRQLIGVETRFNILFYNFQSGTAIHRNSGCFGEPGIFSAYLLLAIMFLGLQKNNYTVRQYHKVILVLIMALLTTFSTTGYIILPVGLLLHTELTNISKHKIPQFLIASAIIIFLGIVFYQLDFVGNKIKDQYDEAIMGQADNWHLTRIGTFLYDFEYIKQRPFFGWGLYETTRFALDGGETIDGMGNGLTDFICKFGLIGMATWTVFLCKGILRITNFDRAKTTLFAISVLLILNGEPLFNFPLFLGLMFVGMQPTSFDSQLQHRTYPAYNPKVNRAGLTGSLING